MTFLILKLRQKERRAMGTTSDEIYDLFMLNIQNDVTLNTIYTSSGSSAAVIYSEPWLLSAIDAYGRVSVEDLSYTKSSGSSIGYFAADLSTRSQNILARTMVKFWLQWKVNDSIALGRYFKDREYSMTAPMLPSLQNYLILVTENVDQMLGEYAWDKDVDWAKWQNQDFSSTT
jgi:hypothetical protein